jgi:hypothetical protein
MRAESHLEAVVELHPDGERDPDGSRLDGILAAYLHAEHAHGFRCLLWRRLGLIAGSAALAHVAAGVASEVVFAVILAVVGGAGLAGSLIEWLARRKLTHLLAGRRPKPKGARRPRSPGTNRLPRTLQSPFRLFILEGSDGSRGHDATRLRVAERWRH